MMKKAKTPQSVNIVQKGNIPQSENAVQNENIPQSEKIIKNGKNKKFSSVDIALLPSLGALMFVSKLLTEALPNIHFLALFIIVFTVLFRKKALISIYIFVLLTGFYGGFTVWWIPYLYIWLPLWLIIMLLPKNMNVKIAVPVYMICGGLHGILYGTLYAPFQAIAFGMNFPSTLAWIISGLPWDALHGISNFCICSLAVPIISTLKKVMKK